MSLVCLGVDCPHAQVNNQIVYYYCLFHTDMKLAIKENCMIMLVSTTILA